MSTQIKFDATMDKFQVTVGSMSLWATQAEIDAAMKCKLCGDLEFFHWGKQRNEQLRELGVCFDCEFWIEKRQYKDDPKQIVANGNMYRIGDETWTDMPSWRGFGGRKFIIRRLATDEVVVTTNLWHNGEIPAHFREEFPDNVEFLKEMPKRPVDILFPERREQMSKGICTTCGEVVDCSEMSELDLKELKISGMCKACQDSVFN